MVGVSELGIARSDSRPTAWPTLVADSPYVSGPSAEDGASGACFVVEIWTKYFRPTRLIKHEPAVLRPRSKSPARVTQPFDAYSLRMLWTTMMKRRPRRVHGRRDIDKKFVESILSVRRAAFKLARSDSRPIA